MIDVPDRPDVYVRLAAIKFFLRHDCSLILIFVCHPIGICIFFVCHPRKGICVCPSLARRQTQ
jgi:hypothetical protein